MFGITTGITRTIHDQTTEATVNIPRSLKVRAAEAVMDFSL
jgi:hypothetical protein